MSTTTTELRASDIERERVARILRAATGTGLLSLAEVEERLSACYAAKYRHELQPLTADLPDPGGLLAGTPEARQAAHGRLTRHAALVAILAAALVLGWMASGAEFFWPIWPIAFLIFGLVRHIRRVRPGTQA
ncbi:MAG: DUF1707 SHOCT-like domain-containing protein [Pseudonocardiaceae bacterium]